MNYKAWKIIEDDYFREITTRGRLEFLVGFAVLAPSSHNAQPWKFKISGNSIEVLPDLSRAVPIADPKEKCLYTGLGCAIENIVIAADYFKLKPRVIYEPYDSKEVAARIELSFSDEQDSANATKDSSHLIHEIPKRCSNRNKYDPDKKVSAEFLKELISYSGKGITITISTESKKRNMLAGIVMDSRIKIFNDTSFRHEISRYKKNNLTRSFVGITGNTMGFNTLQSFVAPFAIKYMNVLRFIEKSEKELFSTYSPVHLIVSIKKETRQSWMKAGRIFQNICLRANQKGIASAISLLPNTTDIKSIKKMFSITYNPYIFIRLGYADKIPPHAPRLRAKDVSS